MVEVKERPKERSRSERTEAMAIRKIGIVGAGQMGNGIAHVCALAGFEVALTDISEEALQRGREAIDRNLSRQVARGKIREEDKAAVLGRIRTGLDYALFGDCDMVIEAAAERAIDIGARTYGSVKSILDNHLDRRSAQKRATDGTPILHANIRGPRYYN